MKLFSSGTKKEKGQDKAKTARPAKKTAKKADSGNKLVSALNDLLKQNGRALTGRVHMLGLSAIRDRMGSKWESYKDHVYSHTESIISRHIRFNDVFERYGDDEYMLVFSDASEEISKAKLLKISKEIRQHFLGDEDLSEIRVTTALTDVEGNVVMEDIDLSAIARELAQKAHQVGSEGPPETPEAEAKKEPSLELGKDKEEKRKKLQNRFSNFRPHDLKFYFRPLWDIPNQVISTYQCVPLAELSRQVTVEGYEMLSEEYGGGEISALDLETLEYALDIFGECMENNFKLFMVIPVHFETLSTSSTRKEYIEVIRILPPALRPFLMFEICGLPQGVPHGRLAEMSQAIRPYCRYLMVRIDRLKKWNFANYSEVGIKVATLDKDFQGMGIKARTDVIDRFAKTARGAGLNSCILRVEDMQTAVLADKSKVTFLSGGAVGTMGLMPEAIRRFTRKDFAKKFTK